MVETFKGSCIRVWSETNTWINCIFLVDEKEKERAAAVLREAWDDFWDAGDDWCIGDFLEMRLREAWIGFEAYYAHENEE